MFLTKQKSTARAFLEFYANIRGDQLIIYHRKNLNNIQVTQLIVGGVITTCTKLKSGIDLKNDILKLIITDEILLTVDDAPDSIGPKTTNQQFQIMMEENVTIEEDPISLRTIYSYNLCRCRF